MDSRADWKNWLQEAGIDDAAVTHGPVLNRASMVIDAAINGQGIALARTTLAAWDLINGRLVRPFAESLPLAKTYWIICPKATASAAEDRDLSRLAAGGSRKRSAPAPEEGTGGPLDIVMSRELRAVESSNCSEHIRTAL